MHIQEIVIDGFKSYAHRTTVEGFDPHFNAITGLNGSGKSNILDSICFVLGITNLSQVRAGNLSELVYKQGQAGVNKATVAIVFNNEDKENSPVGYERCSEVTVTRQVLIGGKSKYLINGKNAPAGQVQNLFHSVQLNVNNPHFLIMQGRITKVLNMKPIEIIGMIEEAAGTRMYETKRVNALKTIEKKQAKLDELNSVLAEEITPTLERLRGEKQNYLKWSKNNADIERMERFVIAHAFEKARKALESNAEGSEEMEQKVNELERKVNEHKEEIEKAEREIAERSSRIKGDFEDKLVAAKKKEQKMSNELVRITSAWKNSKETLALAESDLKAAEILADETRQAVEAKESNIGEYSDEIERKRQAAKAAEENLSRLTLDYQNMSAGISSSLGDEGRTLPEQISQAHSDSKSAEAKVQQAKMKIAHLLKELKSVESKILQEGNASKDLENKYRIASQRLAETKEQLNSLHFSESEFTRLEDEKEGLETTITELSERVDALSAQLQSRLSFRYSDPVRGFDRSKVKGLVAKLVNIQDPKHSTALEVVAGGKLFQVVVDEAITGKALLERGKLERRVTIIPLDKIQSRQIPESSCRKANEIASSMQATAQPAIELVGFDEEVRSAIEYVFGSTIIVDGMKAANHICDATKTRTVTLEGDVYDPSGTISGGSKNQLGTTLAKLSELADASKALEMKQLLLKTVINKYNASKCISLEFEKLSAKLELSEAELEASSKQLSQTNFGMLTEKRDSMRADLLAAENECECMAKEKDDKWRLYKDLQEKEVELTKEREDRLASIEKAVKDAKATYSELSKLAREAESQAQTQTLELGGLKDEVHAAVEAVRIAQKAAIDAATDESDKQMEVGTIHAAFEEARQELEELEQSVSHLSSEISDLKHLKTKLIKASEAAKLESKKTSVQIERIRKERSSAEKEVTSILKKLSWIDSEKSAFGIRGGDYDFDGTNPSETAKVLSELQSEQESLAKKINKKVMGMIEKAEGEYTELLRKRKVVENDKTKIQNVISELDVKKKSELQRTWVKVNRDFGSVFSTLLPGASAKLEPPEGMAAWEGLEVKVAFGDVWKESLSELSGGQRSLLALSLILSLLLFKPAPMYILDEVDAALDLSHTQNIGNMLKTHFSQSQFIVVSLKEGMFNNANVIFRTKFVDGVSQVARTIGTGLSRPRSFVSSENTRDEDTNGKSLSQKTRKRGKENAMF